MCLGCPNGSASVVSSFRVPHPSVAVSSNVCHRARMMGTNDPDDTPLNNHDGPDPSLQSTSILQASRVNKVNAGRCCTVHYVILAPLLLYSKTLPTWLTDRKHRARHETSASFTGAMARAACAPRPEARGS